MVLYVVHGVVLYCMYCMELYGIVRYYLALYCRVLYVLYVLHGIVWYCKVLYCMVLYVLYFLWRCKRIVNISERTGPSNQRTVVVAVGQWQPSNSRQTPTPEALVHRPLRVESSSSSSASCSSTSASVSGRTEHPSTSVALSECNPKYTAVKATRQEPPEMLVFQNTVMKLVCFSRTDRLE